MDFLSLKLRNGEKVIYPDTQTKPVSNTDEDRPTNLQSHRDHRRIITQERSRVAMHKRKYQAAVTIQRAWRRSHQADSFHVQKYFHFKRLIGQHS